MSFKMNDAIDVCLSECKPLPEAVRDWPRAAGGRQIGRSSIYSYATNGFHGVKLRTVCVPGVGRVTHRKWIERFILAVNAAMEGAAS